MVKERDRLLPQSSLRMSRQKKHEIGARHRVIVQEKTLTEPQLQADGQIRDRANAATPASFSARMSPHPSVRSCFSVSGLHGCPKSLEFFLRKKQYSVSDAPSAVGSMAPPSHSLRPRSRLASPAQGRRAPLCRRISGASTWRPPLRSLSGTPGSDFLAREALKARIDPPFPSPQTSLSS